jgi:CRISPR/Cas system-associated protein Cas5 (RAMP superfamily)
MARQLATPNHENRQFIALAKENNLHPVFLEYYGDKFTSNNKYKHSLGRLHIQNGTDKNDNSIIENVTIVDFNKYNGHKLQEVKTTWDESLIDFHKKLFTSYNINNVSFFNENDWYKKSESEKPEEFYLKFFILNTCFGIIFENFLTSKNSEGDFTKNIVLPTIEKVINLVGVKPLIVTIESTNLETDDFWYYHLPIIKKLIK